MRTAAVLLAGLLAYLGSLDGPFVFDDVPGILENDSIRNLGDWRTVLDPPAEGAGIDSRPIVNLSLDQGVPDEKVKDEGRWCRIDPPAPE